MKYFLNILKKIISNLRFDFMTFFEKIEQQKILTGKALAQINSSFGVLKNIQDAEFKVFSQFGEDGIIEYLIQRIDIDKKSTSFIEFGVENYQESNSRFLLQNRNWRGLVIDGDKRNINYVKNSNLYWRHDITAVDDFIDIGNINKIITDSGFCGEVGLLSIDIDGNDYWIWESIHVISPIIVIVEYNSIFGPILPITIPYNPNFTRTNAHYSNLYWGASIGSLDYLAKKKGYSLVGSNSAGNNVFFVRNDCLGDIRVVSSKEAWVDSRFRESRNSRGELTFLSGNERIKQIQDMMVVDVTNGKQFQLKSLINNSTENFNFLG